MTPATAITSGDWPVSNVQPAHQTQRQHAEDGVEPGEARSEIRAVRTWSWWSASVGV
jgi:hypothetical protein